MRRILETQNLILREFNLEDIPKIYLMSQEESIKKWLPDQVYRDEEEAEDIVKFLISNYTDEFNFYESPYILGVISKDTDKLIGHVGLSPLKNNVEIGYATEVVKCITEWAVNNNKLKNIIGVVNINNHSSCKVLEKSGYKIIRKEYRKAFGHLCTCLIYIYK